MHEVFSPFLLPFRLYSSLEASVLVVNDRGTRVGLKAFTFAHFTDGVSVFRKNGMVSLISTRI